VKFAIDHKSPVPLHAQVEILLRELIKLPEYQNKELLPNEVGMAKQLGISRNTVRQAINKLVYEGLIVRKKGVGTVVADKSVNTRIQNWLSFSQEMKAMGIKIKNFELDVRWVEAEEKVANFFGIPAGKKILRMDKLRGRPDHPFVFFISYFHPRVGLTENDDFERPLYELLEKEHSIVVKTSKEELSALAANEQIAKKLDINPGDPILKRKRFVFDPGGRPVEYNLGFYRADSFVYTIESEREL
jgi:GntR family transcriptional regulator